MDGIKRVDETVDDGDDRVNAALHGILNRRPNCADEIADICPNRHCVGLDEVPVGSNGDCEGSDYENCQANGATEGSDNDSNGFDNGSDGDNCYAYDPNHQRKCSQRCGADYDGIGKFRILSCPRSNVRDDGFE